jgi:aminobenzoyl-glutamate utilization protein B
MVNAAKTLAFTVHDLMTDPALVAQARQEFERKRGAGFVYRPLIGERAPPLDYRK